MPVLVFFPALMRVNYASLDVADPRYSIRAVCIAATIVTATADISNMCFFAAPWSRSTPSHRGGSLVNSAGERKASFV
jgi:hypothetical protein